MKNLHCHWHPWLCLNRWKNKRTLAFKSHRVELTFLDFLPLIKLVVVRSQILRFEKLALKSLLFKRTRFLQGVSVGWGGCIGKACFTLSFFLCLAFKGRERHRFLPLARVVLISIIVSWSSRWVLYFIFMDARI